MGQDENCAVARHVLLGHSLVGYGSLALPVSADHAVPAGAAVHLLAVYYTC
jgi:hypothetical protein